MGAENRENGGKFDVQAEKERTSNVRVCQFRHGRKRKNNYTKRQVICQEGK